MADLQSQDYIRRSATTMTPPSEARSAAIAATGAVKARAATAICKRERQAVCMPYGSGPQA